ncbi:MAG: type II toxin-antitoxin system Phd/YefM family antitoxin [Anaerolineae bacterium]|jgi:prevent-host-death family protein|nr:type II toxin-antitoxin system Phd/YefM family antitoxin [Anaerolineae bacterium]MDH7474992.1 type II toxin-antitoxin system Phd/YefM family antitoxin [Anaerolineae bacterium]
MPTLISAVDFHRKAGDLLARIRYQGERFIIERRGQPIAVLLGIEEFRQLEALAARQRAAERDAHFAAFESALEAASPPAADAAELSDETIQAEVDTVREARRAQGGH